MNPLVSICIPAYKQPALLERCLESISKQLYNPVEIHISDDTPDDSVKIIAEKFAHELNISYHQNLKPLGSPQNWNAAINGAKGKYVLLLHHDDFFTNEHSLAKFIAPLENYPTIDFVFARNPSIENLSLGKSFSNIFFQRYYNEPELLLAGNYIGAPSNVMFRITAVEPFHPKYKWIVDIEFYIRLFKSKKRFFYIDEKLIEIGIHEGQVSNECITNHQVLLFENIHYAMENNVKVKSLQLFDFYWRLIRNANLKTTKQLKEIGLPLNNIPDFLCQIISFQQMIPGSLLKLGIVSKPLMALGFLKYKLS